jgi:hypothetical protein
MQLRDPLGGRGGAAEQLQQSMAGLSLMGSQGVGQPPPPPPPQAQMMLEGGVMVPQARHSTLPLPSARNLIWLPRITFFTIFLMLVGSHSCMEGHGWNIVTVTVPSHC